MMGYRFSLPSFLFFRWKVLDFCFDLQFLSEKVWHVIVSTWNYFETWRLHHFGFINGCIQVVDKDRFSFKGNHFSNIAGHDTEKPVKAWLRQSGSKVLCKPNDSVSIEHSSQIFLLPLHFCKMHNLSWKEDVLLHCRNSSHVDYSFVHFDIPCNLDTG
jgi:hypothetical protein